jgi:hypothetical protein
VSENKREARKIAIDAELLRQVETSLGEKGVAEVAAFVEHCVEKELRARRESAEKILAERLRALGYLE